MDRQRLIRRFARQSLRPNSPRRPLEECRLGTRLVDVRNGLKHNRMSSFWILDCENSYHIEHRCYSRQIRLQRLEDLRIVQYIEHVTDRLQKNLPQIKSYIDTTNTTALSAIQTQQCTRQLLLRATHHQSYQRGSGAGGLR